MTMHLYMIPVIYFSWSVFYLQIMNAIPSGISQSFTDTPSFTVFFHCFSQLRRISSFGIKAISFSPVYQHFTF